MGRHAIDDELMTEHVKAHHAEIAKLGLYLASVKDPEVRRMIGLQRAMMEQHVETMESLLRGASATLPPIPITPPPMPQGQHESPLSDHDVAMDCRMTAVGMGSDNYWSAEHMHDNTARHIHFQMAEQNATMASLYATHLKEHKERMTDALR